jgi:hypothetical protein
MLLIKIFIQHTSTAAIHFRIITITSHIQQVLIGFSAVWDLRIGNKAQQSVAHKAGIYVSLADMPEGLKLFQIPVGNYQGIQASALPRRFCPL